MIKIEDVVSVWGPFDGCCNNGGTESSDGYILMGSTENTSNLPFHLISKPKQ